MGQPFLQQHRAAIRAIAVAVLLTACGACGGGAGGDGGDAGDGAPTASPPPLAATPSTPALRPTPAHPSTPPAGSSPAGSPVPPGDGLDPARISIPAIDVNAEVGDLGLNPDGTMEVPDDFSATGWFRHGPRPGQQGPAVIAGHVDSTSGPAVFYRLGELQPGQRIRVAAPHGDAVTFAVQRVEQYPKEAFPTEAVYAFTEDPTLRLVTCGGPFNETIGHYEHNVIVFARRVAFTADAGHAVGVRPT